MKKNMAIILIIAGSILLIIGLTLSLKSIKPMYLNVVSGLIIIIGTFFGLFGKQLQDKSSSEKSDSILKTSANTEEKVDNLKSQNEALNKISEELKEKIETQASTIDKLRRENTELYGKLSIASTEIYNNLTGGDSFCRMEIRDIGPQAERGSVIFFVDGENPLNRVQVRIVDLNTINKNSFSLEEINKNYFDIGALDPGKAFMTPYIIKLDKVKGVNLNIFFSANNGFTTQLIRMKYTNNKWVSAQTVIRLKDGKELYLKIDSDFPEKNKNKIFKE